MFKVLTLLIKKIFGKYTYICPIVSFHKNRFILYVHLEREYQEILFELKKNSKTLFSCQNTAEFLKRSIKYVWTSFHGCCDLRYTSDLAYLVMNWLTYFDIFFVKLANKIFFIFSSNHTYFPVCEKFNFKSHFSIKSHDETNTKYGKITQQKFQETEKNKIG